MTPFEFIALRGTKPGGIIVSEFAGIGNELLSVNRVNPFDITNLSYAMKELLIVEKSQKVNVYRGQDLEFIKKNNTQKWASSFLTDLKRSKKDTENYKYVPHGGTDKLKLIKLHKDLIRLDSNPDFVHSYNQACNRIIFIDCESTLVDIDERFGHSVNIQQTNLVHALE